MTRVHLSTLFLLAVTGLGCGVAEPASPGAGEPVSPPASKPASFVLVVVDCLRAEEPTAARGYESPPASNGASSAGPKVSVMPRLGQLAQTGWTFTRAYAQSTWTKPCIASLLTSSYPEVHRVLFGLDVKPSPTTRLLEPEIDVLPEEYLTLARLMKEAGRHTIGIQANPLLGTEFGFSSGFDAYDTVCGDAKELTDRVLDEIWAHPSPFFAYVHYMDLHDPYDAPVEFDCPFGTPPSMADPETRRRCFGQEPPPVPADVTEPPDRYYHQLLFRAGCRNAPELPPISEEGRRYLRFHYDWNASYVDVHLRRLVDSLRRHDPNIYFVITADHGEEFWEHGNLGHTRTPYEETVHVPLIILGPNLKPCTVDALVEHIDVAPTLAALGGIAPSGNWQGVSLADTDGRAASHKKQVFNMTRSWQRSANQYIDMVLEEPYKLIRDRTKGTRELYNLVRDPRETTNTIQADPAVASRLTADLDRHAEQPHPYRQIPVPMLHAVAPEVAGQIEALGYGGAKR